MYDRAVTHPRERLVQIARLAGAGAFTERFGPPQTAEPETEALRGLVEERIDTIAAALVGEAAASDDVIDTESGQAYLEDRLQTLGDLLTKEQVERVRQVFRERTAAW